ncbi:MAG: hypothetical protein ACP5II_04570 [Infirmifilum sp.]|jgi:hypothetical protein|uniref:hypothetical protein n=1 Tax=Infirmifilum sp. TaxID=2856575 RepID=UPI0023578AE0
MDKLKAFILTLGVSGTTLAIYSYFILGNIPLTALGIGALVTSASLAQTPRESPYREAAIAALQAYAVNIARLMEELSARPPSTYLPEGILLVPLGGSAKPTLRPEPDRLIWKDTNGHFLVLSTPSYGVEKSSNLESSLEYVLVDTLGLCDGVRVVERDTLILVELEGVRSLGEPARFRQVLGSLQAHVAASVAAASLNSPVTVEGIESRGKSLILRLARGEGLA